MTRWIAILVLALCAMATPATEKASVLLKSIIDFRADLYKKAFENAKGDAKKVDFASIQSQVKAKAEEAIKGLEVAKIDPKETLDWAQILTLANRGKDAEMLLTTYVAGKPEPGQLYAAQKMLLSSTLAAGDDKATIAMLDKIKPFDIYSELEYAGLVVSFAPKEASVLGPDNGVAMIDKASAAVDKAALVGPLRGRFSALQTEAWLAEIDIYRAANQKDMAIKVIDAAVKTASDEAKSRLTVIRTQLTLVGQPAPALKIDRSTGKFPALDDLRGKVVVVEFFGHWFGPCKDALPDLKKMIADLQPKGLEVVGVTRYYGFFGDPSKRLTPDVEFASMTDSLKSQNATWPIGLGSNENFLAYGVMSIPQFVVISRTGMVKEVWVGYTAERFAELRKRIEALLEER